MTPDDQNLIEALTDDALGSQAELVRKSLFRHMIHGQRVQRLGAEFIRLGLPLRRSFEAAGINYQLARHSLWIAEVLSRLGETHPEICEFGPSLVLLVREAEQRFEREGRLAELAEVIAAIAQGMPRSKVRERFLSPKRPATCATVLAALAARHFEHAKGLYERCNVDERRRLECVSDTLPDLIKREVVEVRVRVASAASTIEEAVCALAPSTGHAVERLQAGYSE